MCPIFSWYYDERLEETEILEEIKYNITLLTGVSIYQRKTIKIGSGILKLNFMSTNEYLSSSHV